MTEKIKVVVAEDVDVLRENLCEMIEASGEIHVIYSAKSGQDVVDYFENVNKVKPDVVLLDIDMETKDAGIKAAERIIAIYPDVKIIFLTVHEDEETVIEAMSTGGVDYVIKTVDCKEAIAHIKAAYKDKVEIDGKIQKVMNTEFFRMKTRQSKNVDIIRTIILLSPAEREIIAMLLQGKKVAEIAALRFVEPVTIKKQIGTILKKFDCVRSKEVVALIKEYRIENIFMQE